VVGRLRHLDGTAGLDNSSTLYDQLLSGRELEDDLFRRVPAVFDDRDPTPVWPVENSHSPWTISEGHINKLA